jgi:hypothetical protein
MSVRVRGARSAGGVRDEPYDTSILGRVRNYFRTWVTPSANRDNRDVDEHQAANAAEANARAAERRNYEERLVSIAPPTDAANRFAESLASQRTSANAAHFAYPQTPSTTNDYNNNYYSNNNNNDDVRLVSIRSVAAASADASPLKKRTRDEAHINVNDNDDNDIAADVRTNGHAAVAVPATFEFDLTPTKRRLVVSNTNGSNSSNGQATPATASRSVHDILSALDKLTSPLVEAARSPRPVSPVPASVKATRPAIAHPLRASTVAIDLTPIRQSPVAVSQRLGLAADDNDDVDDTIADQTHQQSPPPSAALDTRTGGMPSDVPTRVPSAGATRAAYTPQSGLRLPPTVLAARWATERANNAAAKSAGTPIVDTPRPASARAAAEAAAAATPIASAVPVARVRESPLLPVVPTTPVTPSRASPRAQPPAVVVARDAAALSSANDSLCDGERLTSRVRDALAAGTTSGMRDGWLLALTTLDKSLRKDSLLLDSISTEALLEARTETATSITKLIADIGKLTERVTSLPATTAAVPTAVVNVASVATGGMDVFKVPPPIVKAAKAKEIDDSAAKAGWKCVGCDADNDASAKNCHVCAAAKPSAAETAAAAAENAAAAVAASAVAAAAAPKKKVTFAIGDGKSDGDKSDDAGDTVAKALFGAVKSTADADSGDKAKAPVFKFGAPSSSSSSEQPKTDKPVFQFGATDKEKEKDQDKEANKDDAGAAKKPVFQFGSGSTPTTPSSSAADVTSTPVTKAPMFNFGGSSADKKRQSPTDVSSSQPKFGSGSLSSQPQFGAKTGGDAAATPAADSAAATKPVFDFGKPAATPTSTPATGSSSGKPVFQFGAAASTAPVSPPTTTPPTGGARVFQFGSTSTPTPAAATPASGDGGLVKAPSFQFGSGATPASTPASGGAATGGAAKPFQFGASGGAAAATPATSSTPAFQFGAAATATSATPAAATSGKPSFQFGAASGGAAATTPAASSATPFQFGASTPAAGGATASGSGAPAFQFGSGAKPPTTGGGAFGFGAAAATGAASPFGGATPTATPAAGATPAFGFGAAAAFGGGSFGSGGAPSFGAASQGSPGGGGEGEDANSPFSFRPGTAGRKRVVARGRKK